MLRSLFAGVLLVCIAVAPVAGRADEASHLKAAQDMLVATGMEVSINQAINQMLDAQSQQMPRIGAYRDVMKAFLDKYMSWAVMKDDVAKLYAANFTEDELKELTAFYHTPTGRKAIRLLPALMAQGMALSQQRVQAHIGELQATMKEAEKKNAAPAPKAP